MINKINILTTEDSSPTLFSEHFNQCYHSGRGAEGEAKHVFIDAGLNYIKKREINIFEVGFGTGLNAALTYFAAGINGIKINYVTIEKYPLPCEVIEGFIKRTNRQKILSVLHNCEWSVKNEISENFSFTKINADFITHKIVGNFDLVYFDAFSYDVQPEMWTVEVFESIYDKLYNSGVLVTYSAKGVVKRNLRKVGFYVKRLQGYKKYHMLRACK